MAIGQITEFLQKDYIELSSRTVNRSAQVFTPFTTNEKDAGYVFSGSEFFRGFLFNGGSVSLTIDDIVTAEADGTELTGIAALDTIAANSSAEFVVEVTKYGPLVFTATWTFTSACTTDPVLTITGTRPLISTAQPRPIDLSTAMEEAYAYADGSNTFYDTLEFVSSLSGEKVMVVYSDEDLVTPQGTFIPCKFECRLPETESAVRGEMLVSVEFLPREAQIWLRQTSQSRGRLTVRWRQYLGPNMEPDAEYPIPLEIVSVDQTPTGVTATALFPDILSAIFPRRLMTTKELPGGII